MDWCRSVENSMLFVSVAQWIERNVADVEVGGSSPSRDAREEYQSGRNGPASKAVVWVTEPWVRIPPPPPRITNGRSSKLLCLIGDEKGLTMCMPAPTNTRIPPPPQNLYQKKSLPRCKIPEYGNRKMVPSTNKGNYYDPSSR